MNPTELAQQTERLDWSIAYSKERMQQIVASSEISLDLKRIRVGVHIKSLLEDAMKVLPKKRQHELQACLDLYEQVWHDERLVASHSQTDGSFSRLQAE